MCPACIVTVVLIAAGAASAGGLAAFAAKTPKNIVSKNQTQGGQNESIEHSRE